MATRLTIAAEPTYFNGASVQSRLLGFGLRHTVRPLLGLWSHLPVDVFPPNVLDHASRLLPVPEGTRWRTIRTAGFTSEWLSAAGVGDIHDNNPRAIIYFHGGAFLTCGLNTHRRLVARISAAAEQPVLNVGYRQMPHEPITESIADGLAAFRALLEQGYATENITIVGDSAGGYLAFSVARAVLDQGLGRPAGVVALSPLLDVDASRKAAHRNANRCATFPISALERFAQVSLRLENRRGVSGRRTCPVNMPVDDLPPSLIQVGSSEVLVADAELMANRLAQAGVPCELQIWDRQVHVFQAASLWVPEARRAIAEIGEFISDLATQHASGENVVTTEPQTRVVRTPRMSAARVGARRRTVS